MNDGKCSHGVVTASKMVGPRLLMSVPSKYETSTFAVESNCLGLYLPVIDTLFFLASMDNRFLATEG